MKRLLTGLLILLLFGSMTATVSAFDPIGIDAVSQAEQWQNIDLQWVNGAINVNSGLLSEGDSVAYRYLIDGLTPNQLVCLTFTYDFQKSSTGNIHTFDFPTSYDATEAITTAQLLSFSGNSAGFSVIPLSSIDFQAEPIPDDPGIVQDDAYRAAFGQQYIGAGGDLDPTSVVFIGAQYVAGGSGTITRTITINVRAKSTILYGGRGIVLWGAHLALGGTTALPADPPAGWGAGNGAGSANGAYYHMLVSGFQDKNGNGVEDSNEGLGGGDIQLQNGVVLIFPVCVSGYKLDYCTGEGLEGWTITLTKPGTGGQVTCTTDTSGYYSFCGLIPTSQSQTYSLTETVKPGWWAMGPTTIGPFTLGTSGLTNQNFTNHAPLCLKGTLESIDGSSPAGYTVKLTNSTGAVLGTDTTNANGEFGESGEFCGLPPGDTYTFKVYMAGVTDPIATSDPIPLTTTSCPADVSIQFSQPLRCISGYKLDQCTGAGLEGWTITLSGDGSGSTTTNDTGYYEFCSLRPGDYTVKETLESGWKAVTPAVDIGHSVTLTGTASSFNNNFTNTRLLCINGTVLGCGDQPVAGVTITLSKPGATDITTTTNAQGEYSFCGLEPGDYTVAQTPLNGFGDPVPFATPVTTHDVTLVCGDSTGNDFANTPNSLCINGTVTGCGNVGLAGVTMTLTPGGATTTTDSNGDYSFCGLEPGEYTVTQAQVDGYAAPPTLSAITLACENSEGNDFENLINSLCINGTVTGCNGAAVEGVLVTVTNKTTQATAGTDTTDATGAYSVCGLVPGEYIVSQTPLDGFGNPVPSVTPVTTHDVTLVCGDSTGNDFENTPNSLCINGTVTGCGGAVLEGVTITLGGAKTDSTTTGTDGTYSFCGLEPGDYTVTETTPAGYRDLVDPPLDVTLACANSEENNFAITINSLCINGTVLGCGNQPVAGVTITLSKAGSLDVTTTTGTDGTYSFCGLEPGDYTVAQTPLNGFGDPVPFVPPTTHEVTLVCDDSTGNDFANTPNSLCINGTVTGCGDVGLAGVTVTLTPGGATTTTDSNGDYSFCGLEPGEYTVTQAQVDGYAAPPTLSAITLACANSEENNFANTINSLCINGTVLGCGNQPVAGVTITLSGDKTDSTTTNAQGEYSFCGLEPGDYTVAQTPLNGFGDPVPFATPVTTHDVTLVCGDSTGNAFENTPNSLCINGTVTGCGGVALEGVTMTLTPGGATTTTDSNGDYSFCGLEPGDYTVTETTPAGYRDLADPSLDVTLACANSENNDFANTINSLCINGTVLGCGNQPVAGVTITLSKTGSPDVTTTTGTDGTYSFCGLEPGDYTVAQTPLNGFGDPVPFITPITTHDVTLVCGDSTGNDFANTPNSLCINGTVTGCGNVGLADVTITLSKTGATDVTTTTDSNGDYSFCGLEPGEYTVTQAQVDGYAAPPTIDPISLACANSENNDFANTINSLCINGTVLGCGNQPVAGVTITLSGDKTDSTTTNAQGEYSFCGLEPGSYTVAQNPLNGFGDPVPFVPPTTHEVTLVCSDSTGNDFANTPDSLCINGTVTGCGGAVLEGVTITLGGAKTDSTTTNDKGEYSFCGLSPGDYTVTETTPAGYKDLVDPSLDVTLACANSENNDFANTINSLCINGTKKDAAGNGLSGWTITLKKSGQTVGTTTTNTLGEYSFCGLEPGSYTLTETMQTGWIQVSAPGTITLVCSDYENADFVNGQKCGGLTPGYWSNKNGQADITALQQTGVVLFDNAGTPLVKEGLMATWNLWTVDKKGTAIRFYPSSYSQFKPWLTYRDAVDMRYQLSAQLAAMELNVLTGKITGGGCAQIKVSTLVDPDGVMTITELMNAAITALAPGSTASRAYLEALKNALDAGNNNRNWVTCTACSVPG